eukprot:45286_1
MTNANCSTSFFLSNANKVYRCGLNNSNQLGLNNNQNINQPLLIDNISNITDVQGGYFHTILLDNNASVYSTKYTNNYGKHGQNGDGLHNFCNSNTNGFQAISMRHNKRITQISAGACHTLFLDSHASVWCCGRNYYGQLGLGHYNNMSQQNPQIIAYFVDNTIRINNICCGYCHNLCVDVSGIIYGFGSNNYGQCGLPNGIKKPNKPFKICSLSNHKIIDIKCGCYHSYCKSDNDKHWLFGDNEFNECGLSIKNANINAIYEPFCINKTVSVVTNGKPIKEVYIGNYNTWIITGLSEEIVEDKLEEHSYVLNSLDIKNGCVKCLDDSNNELEFKIDKTDNDLIKQIIDIQNMGMEMKQDVFIKTTKQTVIKAFIKNNNNDDDDLKQTMNELEAKNTEKDREITL